MLAKTLVTVSVLCFARVACGQHPSVNQAQPEAPTPVSPASLSDCSQWVVATLKCGVRAAHAVIAVVHIPALTDASQMPFASDDAYGETATGPWTRAGIILSVRSQATGKKFERLKVPGPFFA